MIKLNTNLFCLFFLLFVSINIVAQDKVKRLLEDADGHFEQRTYILAIPFYEDVLAIQPDNKEVNFRLGYCFLQSGSGKPQALQYFEKVYKLDPLYNPVLHFFLAQAYHYNNKIPEAVAQLDMLKYKLESKKGQDIQVFENTNVSVLELLALAEELRKQCNYVTKFFKEPVEAKITNLGKAINTSHGEYAPVISADEKVLVFTSRRKGNIGDQLDFEDNLHYEDIYISYKKKGKWTKAKNMGKSINTKRHEATVGLSADGKIIYLYIDNNGGDLYYSSFSEEKGDWSSPKPMNMINSQYREPSMTISPDGKTIYFSSDRPGGYGELDLYVVHQQDDGSWTEPKNLGDGINTSKNEDSPFLHYDAKTLYFSSEGHVNMGGYDIFFTEQITENNWTVPQNLGHPINSTQDDIHFAITADYQHGYYASARTDGLENLGEKDIYIISMPQYKTTDLEAINFDMILKVVPIEFDPIVTPPIKTAFITLSGSVRDEISNQLLNAHLSVINIQNNEVVKEFDAVTPDGQYSTFLEQGGFYLLHVQKEGYMFHSETFEVPITNQNHEKVIHIKLKRIEKDRVAPFQMQFDYNSAKLKKSSIPALKKLVIFLETNPQVNVEIGGHTDNIGTRERNQVLSTERAKAVYDFLISQNIEENRLSYKGYGLSKPIASNATYRGRQMNRRTECKITDIK